MEICANDLLIHTWDLCQAAGLDAVLDDPRLLSALLEQDPEMKRMLRAAGRRVTSALSSPDRSCPDPLPRVVGRLVAVDLAKAMSSL